MNLLVIGDRFSEQSVRYLSDIANAAREQIYVCSLAVNTASTYEAYWRALYTGDKVCSMSVNGMMTPLAVSIHDVLASRRFDAIMLHQGARVSCELSEYTTYLSLIAKKLHEYAPAAHILISEPWAYRDGSPVLCNTMGYATSAKMAEDIVSTVKQAVDSSDEIFGAVPFCEALITAVNMGLDIYQTPAYPSDLGKYVLSLVLYQCLSRRQVAGNKFFDFDTKINEGDVALAKKCAYDTARARGWRE